MNPPANNNFFVTVSLRMALVCVVMAILGGTLAALHYIQSFSPELAEAGFSLRKLRPLHTTFASVWIYGACVAVIYHYLSNSGDGLSEGDKRRFWFHTFCWLTAGVAVVITLGMGIFSGREYLGFHPAISAVLLIGWLALAYSFLRRNSSLRTFGFIWRVVIAAALFYGYSHFKGQSGGLAIGCLIGGWLVAIDFLRQLCKGIWAQPIYIYFWSIGILYFIYTFVEGHAYLLPWVADKPIYDLGLQWKSCGTLVGSFNFLVYGSLIYSSERLSGDKSYAQGRMAFMLFGIGCLNSFTNYAHHTYHIPQSELVKWISFVVSMLEILIFLRLLIDINKMLKARCATDGYCAANGYFGAAKWWSAIMILSATLISIPNVNSLVHGTRFVMGHAMGTELGIDTLALFGCITFLMYDLFKNRPEVAARLNSQRMRIHNGLMNLAMFVLVTWLSTVGAVHGYYRFHQLQSPEWINLTWIMLPVSGSLVGLSILYLVWQWWPLVFARQGDSPQPMPSQPQQAEPLVGS